MPAPYGRRDWQTRADRALGRMGRGSQQGRFSGTRPVPQSTLGRPSTVDFRDFGDLHHIQGWSITNTSDATFNTTYEPLPDSWNLELNGVRVHRTEFSISGRTVTIDDPADLFKGVTTQGSPWDLEIQFDYRTLGSVPIVSDVSFNQTSGAPNVDAPTGLEVGDVMVLYVMSHFDITAHPAGWTLIEGPTVVSSGGETNYVAAYWKVAAGGDIGANFTLTVSTNSLTAMTVVCVHDATTVQDSSFSHAVATSATEAAATSTAPAAVILHIGSARQTSGGLVLSHSRGDLVLADSGSAGLFLTRVTSETQASSGAITANVVSNTALTAAGITAAAFVVQ